MSRRCTRFLVKCSGNTIDTIDLQFLLWIIVVLCPKPVWRIGEVKRTIGLVCQIIWAIQLLALIAVCQNRDLGFWVDLLQPPHIPACMTDDSEPTVAVQNHAVRSRLRATISS